MFDAKSLTGLSIGNKGESALSDSIDSHQMVRSFSASQKHTKFDMFLTITCARKDFPGTSSLHHWKSSKEWSRSIPDYQLMSEIKHNKLANSIEELYSLISFRNWMESRQLWLDFIFNDVSCHGACTCLFSRCEYQNDSGNFPHEHTILALKKDTLNSWTNDQLNDLIATNVMEIVKPDELAKHMDDGLLSCLKDANDITQDGWRKLKHTCIPQCLCKIGIGNGPENYRCCKQQAVKDTPDPTCHQFIYLPCNLCNATKNILQHAHIYTPPSYDGTWDEKYSLPYFQPTRHMAPCITNVLCNMSPVIPTHFIPNHCASKWHIEVHSQV